MPDRGLATLFFTAITDCEATNETQRHIEIAIGTTAV
jgi:hypothetical protein